MWSSLHLLPIGVEPGLDRGGCGGTALERVENGTAEDVAQDLHPGRLVEEGQVGSGSTVDVEHLLAVQEGVLDAEELGVPVQRLQSRQEAPGPVAQDLSLTAEVDAPQQLQGRIRMGLAFQHSESGATQGRRKMAAAA